MSTKRYDTAVTAVISLAMIVALVVGSYSCKQELDEHGLVSLRMEERMAKKSVSTFWRTGCKYLIRTVTMYQIGTLVAIEGPNESELILTDAAWIPCTKRFSDTLTTGEVKEAEPYPDGQQVLVNRNSIIDAVEWGHDVPREQK